MQKILVLLFLLSNFANAQVDIELPELGDRVSGAISEAEVELLSEQFLQQVYSQAALIVDPIIQEYSELLLYRLSETSLVVDRDFTVILIDDPSLNAFAAPAITRLICTAHSGMPRGNTEFQIRSPTIVMIRARVAISRIVASASWCPDNINAGSK